MNPNPSQAWSGLNALLWRLRLWLARAAPPGAGASHRQPDLPDGVSLPECAIAVAQQGAVAEQTQRHKPQRTSTNPCTGTPAPALCRRVFVERLLDEVWIAEAVHQNSADKMAALCCLERRHILVFDGEADHFKTAFALAVWPSRKQARARAVPSRSLSRCTPAVFLRGPAPKETGPVSVITAQVRRGRAVRYLARVPTQTSLRSSRGPETAVNRDGFLCGM